MDNYKSTFMSLFNDYAKDKCVEYILAELEKNSFSIPELYEKILTPALYSIDECIDLEKDCIWQEHIKTSIVRTIIESIYPLIIKEKKNIRKLNIKVVLTCPEKELHDIGLRMMDDFFSLNGYESIFIGSNTPRDQLCAAISKSNPKYLAISVTDYYLLVEAKKLIQKIKEKYDNNIIIIVGGNAFKKNPSTLSNIGGDICLNNFSDIVALMKGDLEDETCV